MWTKDFLMFFSVNNCAFTFYYLCPKGNLDIRGIGSSTYALRSLLCFLRNCWELEAALSGPHECSDLKFLSRTLPCDATINFIHFTWLHNQYVLVMSSSVIQTNTRDVNAPLSMYTVILPVPCVTCSCYNATLSGPKWFELQFFPLAKTAVIWLTQSFKKCACCVS